MPRISYSSIIFCVGLWAFVGGTVMMVLGIAVYVVTTSWALFFLGVIIGAGGYCTLLDGWRRCRKKVGYCLQEDPAEDYCLWCSDDGGAASPNVRLISVRWFTEEYDPHNVGFHHSGRNQNFTTTSQPAPNTSSESHHTHQFLPTDGAINEGFSGLDLPSYEEVIRQPEIYVVGLQTTYKLPEMSYTEI